MKLGKNHGHETAGLLQGVSGVLSFAVPQKAEQKEAQERKEPEHDTFGCRWSAAILRELSVAHILCCHVPKGKGSDSVHRHKV